MAATLAPIRERAAALAEAPGRVDEILAEGAGVAGAIARETLATVHDHMGFMPASAPPLPRANAGPTAGALNRNT
jgi:hypothetical protein